MLAAASYKCTCLPGYNGTNCDNIIDNCASSPCVNGQCQNKINAFNCSCNAGWTGTKCNLNATLCNVNPCLNNGTCVPTPQNTKNCSCAFGYSGALCATAINYCDTAGFCKNSGVCEYKGPGLFKCNCIGQRFYGPQCQWTSFCNANASVCLNTGVCNNVENSFNCSCPAGYSGTFCETLPSTRTQEGSTASTPGVGGVPYFVIGIIAACLILTIVLVALLYRRHSRIKGQARPVKGRTGPLHSYINPTYIGFEKSLPASLENPNYVSSSAGHGVIYY
jgi:hypothetical protein